MPTFPPVLDAPRREVAKVSVGLIDWQGERTSVSLEVPAANATDNAGINAWVDRVGQASNAAVIRRTVNAETTVSVTAVEAFDEANASVFQKANFIFQNADQESVTVSIPAPDASIFSNADKTTVNPAHPQAQNVIDATLRLLNGITGANGTYAYVQGYASSYSQRGRGGKQFPIIAEPAGGDLPAGAPAIPAGAPPPEDG